MGENNIIMDELTSNMLRVKVKTLMYYLPKEEVNNYYGCDFEFYVVGDNNIPIDIHVWTGKDHKYREKYHKVFPVPEQLRIPLISTKNK